MTILRQQREEDEHRESADEGATREGAASTNRMSDNEALAAINSAVAEALLAVSARCRTCTSSVIWAMPNMVAFSRDGAESNTRVSMALLPNTMVAESRPWVMTVMCSVTVSAMVGVEDGAGDGKPLGRADGIEDGVAEGAGKGSELGDDVGA